jgi:phosphotransferase system HPr-like phosphotransfer protein
VDKVKSFVSHVSKLDLDFDLVSGRYIVDAKSILGILSLDLSRPIKITELDKYSEDKIKEIVDKYLYRD